MSNLDDTAWKKQSESLIEVQKQGTGLEKLVRSVLNWPSGKMVYDVDRGYRVQVDAVYPSLTSPQIVASVTYTNPDQRGHSNENKFQLKVGELVLLKSAYPDVKVVLVLGGAKEAWLSYVLNAFEVFFDEVICLWESGGTERLHAIAQAPSSVQPKHGTFWGQVRAERIARALTADNTPAPNSSVRYGVLDALKAQNPIVYNPTLITNEIAQLCMRRSYDLDGAEWQSYLKENWGSIEMSRNYFNPVEAAVEISLTAAGVAFEGGIARDIAVPSLLHDLGMPETKVSEDFVLFSEALNQPVYVQCKASGGGRTQHGKNIQNRTKEQTTRSILYTCSSTDGKSLHWKEKAFHWISVLDGDWGVTKAETLKYIHMLELAGYDKIFPAGSLLSPDLAVLRQGNPLIEYVTGPLKCRMLKKQ